MGTHNIGFYGELNKIITDLSSNTFLIWTTKTVCSLSVIGSCVIRKTCLLGGSIPAVQPQKIRISELEGCYVNVVKSNALISYMVTMQLICAFVFPYAKGRFSNDPAQ